MNNLVLVEVVHTSSKLLGPVDKFLGRNLLSFSQEVEQRTIWTVFHHYAIHWGLRTYSSVNKDIIVGTK